MAVTDPKVQIARLRARDTHLTEETAVQRIRSQRDIREKVQQAEARGAGRGVVVYNDSDKEALAREIAKAMEKIKSGSPQWWAYLCLAFPPVGVTAAVWNIWRNWTLQKQWAERMKREKAKL